jgi:pyrroline-5-carboxylate reductase
MVFFSVGLAAMALSILANDLNQYYSIKIHLHNTQQTNEKLQKLIDGYGEMIKSIETDPHIVERLATVTLGVEPNSADTAYPKATRREMLAAQKALIAAAPPLEPEPVLPDWLTRCTNPFLRKILFIAGAALILVSFTCFNIKKDADLT